MSEMTKRVPLHEKLPLETPFSLHVFPAYMCNFRCNYCLHSLPDEILQKKGFKRQLMEYNIYKMAIDSCTEFSTKLKALIFAGHGEPLIHPDITKMVAYAKEKQVADRVEVVTNGSLLTRKLADALIAAGLDRLRVSIQGVTSEAYKRTMGKDFDFPAFVEGLRYFYQHKQHTEVYCKIIDVALTEPEDEQKFRDIFTTVADEVAIEYEIPFVQEVDNAALKQNFDRSKQGNSISGAKVCAMPFYMLVLTPNGDVVPCCSTDVPIVLGNIRDMPLMEIWHSSRKNGFCQLHLLGSRGKHPVCSTCSVPRYGMQEGDYLDDHVAELLPAYPIKCENAKD